MTTLIDVLEESGLTGRGGAGFSAATKVRATHTSRADLIVNACDGEVGAAKDGWIVEHHLSSLVEGVALVAGDRTGSVRYAAHRGSLTAARLAAAGLSVLQAPRRYVSSEESALISLAQGGLARPMTKRTPFVYGGRDSQGRRVPPTLVMNAETLWRIAQVHRRGAQWFRGYGTAADPGPRLVSIGGHVARPRVYESAAGVPVADLIDLAGGAQPGARHVGIGGLGGVVLTLDEASGTTWDTPGMAAHGGSLGAGVVTVWDPSECPLDVAGRMIAYGAGESAGQCGPCMFGLPRLADQWSSLARGPNGADYHRLAAHLMLLEGRGACHHPDGVARFARSALRTLAPEFSAHAAGTCGSGRLSHAGLR